MGLIRKLFVGVTLLASLGINILADWGVSKKTGTWDPTVNLRYLLFEKGQDVRGRTRAERKRWETRYRKVMREAARLDEDGSEYVLSDGEKAEVWRAMKYEVIVEAGAGLEGLPDPTYNELGMALLWLEKKRDIRIRRQEQPN